MAYTKYISYKNSNIPMMDCIPEHWLETEVRNAFTKNDIKNESLEETNLLTLSYGSIKRKSINTAGGLLPASFDSYQILNKGMIVLRMLDLQNDKKSLRVGYVNEKGIITSAYIGLKAIIDSNTKYYYYLLHFMDLIKHFYNAGGGVRQSLGYTDFRREKIIIPPKPEQTAIANFLDYKLEKIARFIKNKKQLVSLLKEQKAAIINQAVTKGINPNAKLKPSGIEWLGNIPEHWEVKRIKYLGAAIIGLTYSPTELVKKGEGTLVLRSSNVQNGKLTYDDCVYVTTPIPEKKRTRKGDILICSRNGSIKLIGKNALIDEKASNESFGAFMTIFRSKNYEYLHYFFNSSSFKAQSGLFSTSTINQLTTGILNNIIISIPKTIDEQIEVVNFIKSETEIIEKTISTIEKEIGLVEEYKTALIAEAVTGKIDVRDFKTPELEMPLSMVAEETAAYNKTS